MIGVRPRTAGLGVGIPLHVSLFTCRFRRVSLSRKRGCTECKQNAEGKDRNETFHAISSFCWCCDRRTLKKGAPLPVPDSCFQSQVQPQPRRGSHHQQELPPHHQGPPAMKKRLWTNTRRLLK